MLCKEGKDYNGLGWLWDLLLQRGRFRVHPVGVCMRRVNPPSQHSGGVKRSEVLTVDLMIYPYVPRAAVLVPFPDIQNKLSW